MGRNLNSGPRAALSRFFPSSRPPGEYTPEQRRTVDARLAEGLADIKAGRTYGPFNTADEMVAHMKAPIKKRAAVKKEKRAR